MARRFDVRALVYDFDGVLTDNRVLVNERGEEAVFCNRSDGLAIGMFRRIGVPQFILSTETNSVVQRRADKLKLPCVQGSADKRASILELARTHGLDLARTLYVGNDVNDLPAMEECGMRACPADAHPDVRRAVDIVTTARGGEGVIRELWDVLALSGPTSGDNT